MNRKGQALIEFIIIIPILILIISGIIDFGNIIYEKYKLQNDLDTIQELYVLRKDNDINNYLTNKNININIDNDDNYTTITLSKNISINTIIINNLIGNPYKIEVSKVILEGV